MTSWSIRRGPHVAPRRLPLPIPGGCLVAVPLDTFGAMNDTTSTQNSTPPTSTSPARISWAAVLGFGALALLWPLAGLVGLPSLIGGLAMALVVIAVIGAAWILGAGFGRVPRPIATLTFAGVVAGALITLMSLILGEWGDLGAGIVFLAAVIEIGRSAALGALAGVVAHAIQKARS